jgi:hypothetical protein
MAYNDSGYGLFQGELFGALRTLNGAQIGGFLSLGDCDKFEISPKQKFEDIEESLTGLGMTSAHIPTTTGINVKINLLDIKFENWVRAIWGVHGGAVNAGTVTNEEIVVYPGPSYVPLAHPGISAVVMSAGVLDTDYTVDDVNGGINILEDSAVFTDPEGTAVQVDYAYAAYGGKVQAFARAQPILMLRLNGTNVANPGQPVLANVYQWAPEMAKVINLIEKKKMQFELDGMLLQDTTRPRATPSNPFSQFFEIVKG